MDKNIRLLYLHNFLTDFKVHCAFLVIFFAEITGSYTQAMAILSVTTITAALLEIPTGILSDKWGRKRTIILGSLAAVASISLYAFAENAMTLYFGSFLSGLSYCLYTGNNDALLFDTLKSRNKEAEFHHHLGKTGSMFQLALAISAFLSCFIIEHGLRVIFILGIIPQVFALITSCFFYKPQTHKKQNGHNFKHLLQAIKLIKNNPRLSILVLAQAISHGANESNFQFKTVFVQNLWSLWGVGLYRAINHGLSFLGFWLSGKLIDRFKEIRILAFRELYWFISQITAVILDNIVSPVFMLSGAFLFGPGNVARDNLLHQEFSDKQRATMGSLASLSGSIVFTLMSIAIGQIADYWGVNIAIGFGITVCLLSLPLYVRLFKQH